MNIKYTPEEIQFIRDNIPGRSRGEMTELFNRHFGRSLSLNKMGYLIFTHNLSKLMRKRKMEYGNESKKYDGYIMVKIEGPKIAWVSKCRVVWEKANGPIPEGHAIMFADGNKSNFDLDNLILVSRNELAVMNHLRLVHANKDLTKAGKAVADLIMSIAERERQIGTRRIKGRIKRNEQSGKAEGDDSRSLRKGPSKQKENS
jgi:hypothetical protein